MLVSSCTFTSLDAPARSRGQRRVMVYASELETALDGLLTLCSNAGHPLQVLRFDRESAIAGSSVGKKGVELSLTGAGQKLGLAEVCGRIVKRTAHRGESLSPSRNSLD